MPPDLFAKNIFYILKSQQKLTIVRKCRNLNLNRKIGHKIRLEFIRLKFISLDL